MTTQDLFNMATNSYQNARNLVGKMNDIVARAHSDFNPKAAYVKLDIIVQYLLLETALADGKFVPIEGDFIDKITDTFDVINLFDNVPQGMNWRWFAENKGFSDIKNTIAKLRGVAQAHMRDFAALFAIVDAAVENYDILGELLGYLGEITGCFTRIDGQHDDSELQVAKKVVEEYIAKPWWIIMDSLR